MCVCVGRGIYKKNLINYSKLLPYGKVYGKQNNRETMLLIDGQHEKTDRRQLAPIYTDTRDEKNGKSL